MKYAAFTAIMLACLAVHLTPRAESQQRPNTIEGASSSNPEAQTVSPAVNISSAKVGNCEQSKPPKWYTSPEWALVIVGIITFSVIACQAGEMHSATKEMKRSTDLQKIHFRQWIDIENWSADWPVFATGQEGGVLYVSFEVVNPTKFPLTVQRVIVRVDSQPAIEFQLPQFLSPSSRFSIKTKVALVRAATDDYGNPSFADVTVRLDCLVEYDDVLRKRQPAQQFGYLGVLAYTGSKFKRFATSLNEPTEQP